MLELSGLATAIGSLPHTDPREACDLVLRYLPEIPIWPQLPRRSFRENMYAQFSEGFPGVVLEGERIYVHRLEPEAESLMGSVIALLEENRVDAFPISDDHAAGLHAFLSRKGRIGNPTAIKGQVTGPVSWGLGVTDEGRRPALYDDVLAAALAKHLRMKAAWQEKALQALCPNTIIFMDEPYLASFGSAFVSLSREKVLALWGEVLGGIQGLKGLHCCGNTDWSVVLSAPIDILSFDAYDYGQTLSLYPEEVRRFLGRGGIIAWGIVPTQEEPLGREDLGSLLARLEEAMGFLERKGMPRERLLRQSLITPACGLGSLMPQAAARALELTSALSQALRKKVVVG